MSQTELNPSEVRYARQAEKLSLEATADAPPAQQGKEQADGATAVEAKFITPLDPVIETADGHRLPAVPVVEAHKLNILKDKAEGKRHGPAQELPAGIKEKSADNPPSHQDDSLDHALPPSKTHPLFPPLPLYGPPSLLRNLQCTIFRVTSFFLSTAFLLVIVLGALATTLPKLYYNTWLRLTFRNPRKRRPFFEEEKRRAAVRRDEEKRWSRDQQQKQKRARVAKEKKLASRRSAEPSPAPKEKYEPLEGGPDKLVCDVRYYARRVGLDVEEFKVQTEDGFVIALWHVYDPNEYRPATTSQRRPCSPEVFAGSSHHESHETVSTQYADGNRRYPVLLMHGLLQSAGAYCTNDDSSLAFYLHKSGYDVWLGINRCGFDPEHTLLSYTDPRMWAWNIRQMGVLDLPALISRVLSETSFPRLGLVAHSQGTTETFVALAKEQRPDLGDKISVFCALAPAVYAGPLIGKMYFKFMRVISPGMFRIIFGIHAFIPLMMTAHRLLPPKWYGDMGYLVFSFLFNWSDTRWERELRRRFFLFSPVYVSSESMRWWLGRECFAKHKCVLNTREEGRQEDLEEGNANPDTEAERDRKDRLAWYDDRAPPMAFWVAGSDDLVDGRRLLRRFGLDDNGREMTQTNPEGLVPAVSPSREPHVDVVHAKFIPEYEHLDVLWAVDSIEKVGQEVKEVLWKTMNDHEHQICRPVDGVAENNIDITEKTEGNA